MSRRAKTFTATLAAHLLAAAFLLSWSLPSGELTLQDFQRISSTLGERPGYFPTDNLISNETSFLQVVPALKEMVPPGQAYIGVGPDQNFTYITHTRPAIAFIVDVRRDNLLQHLYFKVLFERSRNRWDYLSLLFGKPLPRNFEPDPAADSKDLVRFFDELPSEFSFFADRMEEIWSTLRRQFPELTTESDYSRIYKIASAFFLENLDIRYRLPRGRTLAVFPTYRRLMTERDTRGELGHFLNSAEGFRFLKELQAGHRVIPVMGNFAGREALGRIGAYLSDNGYRVGAFYLSNVEFYLFQTGSYDRFIANLERIPFHPDGLLIRSHFNHWFGLGRHPATREGYYVTSLVQKTESLLTLHAELPYRDYWDLVTRDYLVPVEAAVP